MLNQNCRTPYIMHRLLFLVLAQLLTTGTCDTNPDPEHKEKHEGNMFVPWTYEDQDWSKDYELCNGNSQSPINIDTDETILNKKLPSITLEGYNLSETEQLDLSNDGHTVKLSLPDSMSISHGFTQKYLATQLHFHWGSGATSGSEHTVDGFQYAAEMHIVHFAAKYGHLNKAALKADGIAVLGVLFQIGAEDNKNYDHIFDKLQDIAEEGANVHIPGFDINMLLPNQLYRFFRYNGSFTTPPCFQSVTWTVFNETVQISQAQLDKLETSLKTGHGMLDSNFRHAQPLNRRTVFASFSSLTSSRRIVPKENSVKLDEDDKSVDGNHFTLGDTLAVIFGTLFGCTVLAFVIYLLKQRKRQRSNTERGQKVIYKPAATMEA
ncbi:carbonic anhydrase 14 isoform X1 [Carcharodon carcharias]|uniref:carbonic anhydrase 14 isoform X1 n=1 Tax=Carcharodon carcharias TaxID=13397 RepID=UPI001B7EBE8B|nr:carbonic anhydrase 14 isoform X1 [Carcharodon carcharias]